jgi:hypothetical protein
MSEVHQNLHALFAQQADVPRKLRALWTLYVTGGLSDEFLIRQLSHDSEYVRSWAVRLLCEDRDPPLDALGRFRELAAGGDSPFVRLHLASVLQRLDAHQRWPLAEALAARAEDANDANLPLMIWYGVEPLLDNDPQRFVALAATTAIPLVRRHVARRVAGSAATVKGLNSLVMLLGDCDDGRIQQDLLAGILQGFQGRRSISMPDAWPKVYAKLKAQVSDSVRQSALELALIFDDPIALAALRKQASDRTAARDDRSRAVQSLVAKKVIDLAPLLLKLVRDPNTQSAALRGLAEYEHSATATTILENYHLFDATGHADAVQTLASRPSWAMALMDAVESKRVPRSDLTAYTARQLRNLRDDRIMERVKTL